MLIKFKANILQENVNMNRITFYICDIAFKHINLLQPSKEDVGVKKRLAEVVFDGLKSDQVWLHNSVSYRAYLRKQKS